MGPSPYACRYFMTGFGKAKVREPDYDPVSVFGRFFGNFSVAVDGALDKITERGNVEGA